MSYSIKDENLYVTGLKKIDWVSKNMPLLNKIMETYKNEKPFNGKKIAMSIHLEAKTAYMALILKKLGANVFITGSNPLSTQDDVAAALVKEGVNVFARYGCSNQEYEEDLKTVLSCIPDLIIDDGGDLVNLLHTKYPEYAKNIIGGCEETTTGVIRLRAMEKEGKLNFPMIAVNDAKCKYLFDNRYGTGQSVWDGINRTTNLIVAGKHVVIAGYGWCGKGVAMRAKGMGAHVIITEIDPIKACEALLDGFDVMTMEEASKTGDMFITVTGCKDVITKKHFYLMKNEVILCNAGHFNVEINMDQLEKEAVKISERRNNIKGYTIANGKTLNIIAEGRLVNLAAGDGHPAEIMDMSFSLQVLNAKYVMDNREVIKNKVYNVSDEIDSYVAKLYLDGKEIKIDNLTTEQKKYLDSWNF